MNQILKFLNRNWIRTAGNVISRKYYPDYRRVDTKRVEVLKTRYGSFIFSHALQEFPDVFEQIEEYQISDLKNSDVVLDIGANIGAFTVKIAHLVKSVIAVEPLFIEELKANVVLNNLNNVSCINAALGTDGLKSNVSFVGKTEEISHISFEKLLEKCSDTPTVLKSDCVGGEWAIPIEELLPFRSIKAEIHNFDFRGKKRDPTVFLKALKAHGYDCDYYFTPDKQMMLHATS